MKNLQALGFEGPCRGGRHPFMVKGDLVLTIPNPHRAEISVDLLVRILRQAYPVKNGTGSPGSSLSHLMLRL
ncbi:MAG: type II toxin-antitoxin system HicA family toxin [Methanoculleus sp.]|uniref:type II toxin-antitoxin system HicA family toxin n=1 Tax=Methanoculleus sp. TaxID=90427 RepID=UPI002630407A|nr:type II toxin-antitoxin system HicA family toxin [Methanoculleus sp.]MDD3216806.1 type II toxin-antitoxin system HicA family toxin [Methanoculleus sp.]